MGQSMVGEASGRKIELFKITLCGTAEVSAPLFLYFFS